MTTNISAVPPPNGASPPTVNVVMISDFNCPWCYVAHKELQIGLSRARQTHPDTLFTLQYRPFELDPTLPAAADKPMCRIACYKAKFGEEKMKKICGMLKERGQSVGIDFKFAGKTRQTTNAHRLALKAWLCGGEAAQTKMMDALFAAFFEEQTDIGCYDYLSKAAESTGLMTADQARVFLESDKLKDEVRCLIRHSVLQGVKGVPLAVLCGTWSIEGAQTAEVFYQSFCHAAVNVKAVANGLVAHEATSGMTTAPHASGGAPSCKTIDTDAATQSGTSAASTPIANSPTSSTFTADVEANGRMALAV